MPGVTSALGPTGLITSDSQRQRAAWPALPSGSLPVPLVFCFSDAPGWLLLPQFQRCRWCFLRVVTLRAGVILQEDRSFLALCASLEAVGLRVVWGAFASWSASFWMQGPAGLTHCRLLSTRSAGGGNCCLSDKSRPFILKFWLCKSYMNWFST